MYTNSWVHLESLALSKCMLFNVCTNHNLIGPRFWVVQYALLFTSARPQIEHKVQVYRCYSDLLLAFL